MKKRSLLTTLIVTVTLMFTLPATGQDNEFKPGGKPVVTIFSKFGVTNSEGKTDLGFDVERVYLGYQYQFSREFSAKVVFDIGDPGVGKFNYTAYVKNAYVEYNPGNLTLAFGMLGTTYFKYQEKLFPYRYIVKPYQDINKIGSSADIGLTIDYKFSDFFTLDIMVVNGEGYKSVQKDSTIRIATGLNISPVDGLFLRGAVDITPGEDAQKTATLFASYGFGPARLGFEYTRQMNQSMVSGEDLGGFSVTASTDVSKTVTLFGRFDNFASDILPGETDPWNLSNDGNMLLLGFDYMPVKGVRIAPNYKGWFPADDLQPGYNSFNLNLEIKF